VVVRVGEGFSFQIKAAVRALRSLGYHTRVRVLSLEDHFTQISDSSFRSQAGATAWLADYPSPSTFLNLFTCRAFVPRSAHNSNWSQFCDPAADALIRRASAAQLTDPRAAEALWERAERRVLDAVPAIPLTNPVHTDLLAARVRNDQEHPLWGLLPDQVWLR
jgi:ABC-type oligopeptide transport system substrate-binding subunit